MDGTGIVAKRGKAINFGAIDMKCNAEEIPENLDGSKPVGWWLAEHCSFTGQAAAGVKDYQLVDYLEVGPEGTFAIAVSKDRLIGIVSPSDSSTPAVWLSWSLSAIRIETDGEQGFLKKRPIWISLAHQDGTVDLREVSRLWRNSGSHQTGQEGSLLKALRE